MNEIYNIYIYKYHIYIYICAYIYNIIYNNLNYLRRIELSTLIINNYTDYLIIFIIYIYILYHMLPANSKLAYIIYLL